jgi:hypothetical protein
MKRFLGKLLKRNVYFSTFFYILMQSRAKFLGRIDFVKAVRVNPELFVFECTLCIQSKVVDSKETRFVFKENRKKNV